MSTNESSGTQEINQNGNQNSTKFNPLENKLPNSAEIKKITKKESKKNKVLDKTIAKNEDPTKNTENSLENICDDTNKKDNNQTLPEEKENPVLSEDSFLLLDPNVSKFRTENPDSVEIDMSKSNMTKPRLPNKTLSKSALPHNNSKLPGELSGQPSVKNTKEDIKYWKNREQELLSKIAELESRVVVKDSNFTGPLDPVASQIQQKLENDLLATTREKENYKNRLQTIEKELYNKQKEVLLDTNLKNFKSSDEIINHLKQQNEDLRNALAKMTAILRDKTTMCISQEKKIAALVNQVESLKEVVAITKDLLNIRNMEVQHLSNDISAMESKIDCERQRHNQMLIKMDEAVKLNSELKKEYETQLKLFQHLRDSYEEKILFLSRDNNGDKTEIPQVEKKNSTKETSNS